MKALLLALALVSLIASCEQSIYGSWSNPYDPLGADSSLGQTGQGGGLVFFKNPNAAQDGWTYLEAAPAGWNGTSADPTVTWSPSSITNASQITLATTASSLGSGATNTTQIFSLFGTGTYAAALCKNYTGGGKSDWYLPSLEEAQLLSRLGKKGLGGFNTSSPYWTSSWTPGTRGSVNVMGVASPNITAIGDAIYSWSPIDNTAMVRPIRRY